MAIALVTGGAGFIGSHLVHALLEKGVEVRVLDDLSSGMNENFLSIQEKVQFTQGDIRDYDTVLSLTKGADYIFHLAAIASVPRCEDNKEMSQEVNVTGTKHVLEAAKECGVKRVVYSSSSAVYGDGSTPPISEASEPQPQSAYARQKLEGEILCEQFAKEHGLHTVALRYFNVFGPHQDPNSDYAAVIPKFIDCIRNNKLPTVYGDGEQTRDFIYVGDVVQANLLCLADVPKGEVYNIGSGYALSINALLSSITSVYLSDVEAQHVKERSGDIVHSCANIDKAKEGLDFSPTVSLEEGLGQIKGVTQ